MTYKDLIWIIPLFVVVYSSIFISVSPVNAITEPTSRTCLNITHLYEEKITHTSSGDFSMNETTHCLYNCTNNECYEPYDVAPEIFIAIAFFCALICLLYTSDACLLYTSPSPRDRS